MKYNLIGDIPCVILSGGKSSRMGKDKSLLPFRDSESLIKYQYDKLSKIFKNIYISTKEDKFNFQANLIFDTTKISSPMVALQSIFQNLEFENIFIITVDTPLIEESTIRELIIKSQNYDITMGQNVVADLKQRFNLFRYELDIDFSMDTANKLDPRLGIAAAILLAAIEGRQSS